MEEQYRYGVLPHHYIRILKVNSDGETYEAELEDIHVDHPYFLPLSWTWPKAEYGDTLATESFLCNGKHFTIQTTLHKALLCLSSQSAPSSFRIWIDAICINEEDAAEKSVQVPMMSTIYGRANRVVVWLGDASHDSDLIMNEGFMGSIVQKLESTVGRVRYSQLPGLGLPEKSDRLWLAIGNLLQRRWFSRLWIVQEVVLAQEIDVLCGRHSVAWEQLVRLAKSMSDAGLNILCGATAPVDLTRIDGFALGAIEFVRKQRPLYDAGTPFILFSGRVRDVEMPIDRVYGFLGIVEEALRTAITVDYSEESRRDLLEDVSSTGALPGDTRLVSSHLQSGVVSRSASSLAVLQGFKAGWSNATPPQHNVSFADDSNNVHVPGFIIDHIEAFVALGGFSDANTEKRLGLGGVVAEWLTREERSFELARNAFKDSDKAFAAHVCTLITDAWSSKSPISHNEWPIVTQAYRDMLEMLNAVKLGSVYTGPAANPGPRQRAVDAFYLEAINRCAKRPYFVTKNGRLGRGPLNMRAGDQICVLYSGYTPFVLRYEDGSDVAKLIGDAYLGGCMDLETMPDEGLDPDQIFTIG